jgi:nucleotide-binding universal stress UspA family protein
MKVLVYVDPAPRGEWAISLAEKLLLPLRSEAILLATEEDAKLQRDLLDRAAGRLSGLSLENRLRAGPAERAVVEEARASSAALVLVPPAGRNALQRLLRGSRVLSVIRGVGTSVLIARRPGARLERLLVGVGGGGESVRLVRDAGALARRLGASVVLLHVATRVELPSSLAPAEPAALPRLEEAARALEELGVSYSIRRREGFAVEEILDELEEGAHDLLVLGVPERGEDRPVQDDLTRRLALRSPVSVLVLRSGFGEALGFPCRRSGTGV